MILPGFGKESQQKLSQAKVLVIGAGGLGCPALLYLTAAGLGKIGLVDFDFVELSNLHRQVIFTEKDVGRPKALAAAERLHARNGQASIIPYQTSLNPSNAEKLVAEYDLVLDGSDNLATRYLVNDVCALLGKPLIYGAIYRYEGQVAIFNQADTTGKVTQYRDLFPELPDSNQIPNCAEAGVIGLLPGIIGCLMANEVIKLVTKIGRPLINQLLTFNALNYETYIMDIISHPSGNEALPKDLNELKNRDYGEICPMELTGVVVAEELESFLANHPEVQLIDVREEAETPKLTAFSYKSFPLSLLEEKMADLAESNSVLVFCQSGIRSAQAATHISKSFPNKKIFQLKGGINSWLAFQSHTHEEK